MSVQQVAPFCRLSSVDESGSPHGVWYCSLAPIPARIKNMETVLWCLALKWLVSICIWITFPYYSTCLQRFSAHSGMDEGEALEFLILAGVFACWSFQIVILANNPLAWEDSEFLLWQSSWNGEGLPKKMQVSVMAQLLWAFGYFEREVQALLGGSFL